MSDDDGDPADVRGRATTRSDDADPAAPSAPDPAAAVEAAADDADPALANEFWAAVLLANVAVGGVGVGALVWLFGGAGLGGGLVLVGVVALLLTARRVRAFGRSDDAAGPAADDADGTDGADGAARRNA